MGRLRIFGSPLADVINRSKQLSDIDAEVANRYRRNALGLFAICAIGLIPWTIFLTFTLSPNYHAHHWRLVWTGFDGMLFISLATTAYLGFRRRQAVVGAAVVTATLLVCDAWFDITLDLGTPDVWGSLASALFVELPLAVLLVYRVYLFLKLTAMVVYPALGYDNLPKSLYRMPNILEASARKTKHRK